MICKKLYCLDIDLSNCRIELHSWQFIIPLGVFLFLTSIPIDIITYMRKRVLSVLPVLHYTKMCTLKESKMILRNALWFTMLRTVEFCLLLSLSEINKSSCSAKPERYSHRCFIYILYFILYTNFFYQRSEKNIWKSQNELWSNPLLFIYFTKYSSAFNNYSEREYYLALYSSLMRSPTEVTTNNYSYLA